MRNLVLIFMLATVIAGCASTPRTKWTDKTMRVLIDPDSIEANHYVRIQQSLVASGKWFVVDRASAFRAIKKEQNQIHREETDRYSDKEKFSHWGKLYSVGGIVVAKAQCTNKQTWFVGKHYLHCLQYISIVDSNTGEVIVAIEAESDGESGETEIAPSWEDAVAKLNNAYPANYQPNKDSQILTDYKELSAEEAKRQKEAIARDQVEQERKPASEGE